MKGEKAQELKEEITGGKINGIRGGESREVRDRIVGPAGITGHGDIALSPFGLSHFLDRGLEEESSAGVMWVISVKGSGDTRPRARFGRPEPGRRSHLNIAWELHDADRHRQAVLD